MSFLQRNSIAGHYIIYDDHINICFLRGLRRKEDAAISTAFVQELERSLQEVKEMAHAETRTMPASPA